MRFSTLIATTDYLLPLALLCLVCLGQSGAAARRLPGHPHGSEESEEDEEDPSLSDVWLMMGIAFGWSFFMIRSLFQPRMDRYATNSVIVRGNVIEARLETETGMPEYHALIDYSFNDTSGDVFQVRKAFITPELLDLGFKNVSIVVVPTDPTSGLILEQWKEAYKAEQDEAVSQRTTLIFTLVLGGIFVVLSILGAAHSVLELPEESQRVGWICLGCAIALMGPVAFFVNRYGSRCVAATMSSVESGVILKGKVAHESSWHAIRNMGRETYTVCGGHKSRRALIDDASSIGTLNMTDEPESRFYFVCMPKCEGLSRSASGTTISSISDPRA